MAVKERLATEFYKERAKRIQDAISLRVPDRVPVIVNFGFFAAKYGGITYKEAMYDGDKMASSWEKCVTDFAPDAYENPFGTRHVGMLADITDYKMMKWPGHGVPDNRSFQYLDFENLKADEYDEFLYDPSDFMLRKFWPRVFGAFEGLGALPPLRTLYSHGAFNSLSALGTPEIDKAFDALDKARKQAAKTASVVKTYTQKMEGLGFPPIYGPSAIVPFDLISDQFRGTRGAMIDMYRCPDKLIQATEKVLPMILESAISAGKRTECNRVFIPLHKGQEYFMSTEQYKRFYWPGFKNLMLGLIEAKLTPCPFVEGEYTSRLEIIKDVPKGKVCYHFERVDMIKAKEVLKDVACIRGGIPITLMCTATPGEIKAHCRKIIDTVGKGGGLIMDAGTALDDARPENVRALIDFTKEYGVYR